MTRRFGVVVAVLLVAVVAPVTTAQAASSQDPRVRQRTLFSMPDPEIVEASGLVDRGGRVYTINDSGAGPVVYGVSARTGRTLSRTTYSVGEVVDVEAVAPGRSGTLWVGDIGDNGADRADLSVYRVRPGDGVSRVRAPRYRLGYPDGAHDAETLLVQPRTQRIFVVTKSALGGTVYVAPRRLRGGGQLNRLRIFARVPGLLTDGTFWPDGRHVLLRTYGTASAYTFPGFRRTGTVTLPPQKQGEGISVGRTGRVLISTEGIDSPVQQVFLPARLTAPKAAVRPTGPDPVAAQAARRARQAQAEASRPAPREGSDWVWVGLVGAGGLGLVWLSLRASRVGGRR